MATQEDDTEVSEDAGRDPRTHVTPHAFGVAPDLLGRELATPWRRGLALLADLALIYGLSLTGGLLFSGLMALVTVWLIVRGARGWPSALGRTALALPVALLVFAVSLAVVYDGPTYGPNAEQWQNFGEAMASGDARLQEGALYQLEDSFEQSWPEGSGVPAIDIGGFGQRDDTANDASAGQLDRREQERRQLIRDYAALVQENRDLRSRLADPSLEDLLSLVAGSLGLTVGWIGLYFTLVPTLWSGRTLGKRLLGLRIVRLNMAPLTPWTAFERFAGYAAGLATGLLGFLQIFWDANRQGVHDKIVGTVVIRES